jgi:hypothetical protein
VTMRNHHQQRRFQRDLCCKVENTGPSYPWNETACDI